MKSRPDGMLNIGRAWGISMKPFVLGLLTIASDLRLQYDCSSELELLSWGDSGMSVLKFQSFCLGLVLAIATAFAFVPVAVAQEDDKPQDAVIMFDLDLESIFASALVKSISLDVMLDSFSVSREMKGSIMDLRRVSGMSSLPESVKVWHPEMLPFDFACTIEFGSEDSLDEVFKDIENNSKTFEKEGVTYYQPPHGESNYCGRKIGKTSFEVGTVNYVTVAQDRDFATDALTKLWKAKTKAPLQIAVDFKGARNFFDSIDEHYGEAFGQPAMYYINLHKSIASLLLSFDPDSSKMLTIVTKSDMADDAETVFNGFEAAIRLAKQYAAFFSAMEPIGEKEAEKWRGLAGIYEALAGGLKAEQNEAEVTLTLTRPKNIEKMISDYLKK
jgi:hypothetical protein